jgi:hypothetical protein
MITYNSAIMLEFREHSNKVIPPKDGIWYVKYNSLYTEAIIIRKNQPDKKVQFLGDSIPLSKLGKLKL